MYSRHKIQDGYLMIPNEPGLGVDIDEEKVRTASQAPHRWRNDIWRLEDGSFTEW